MELDEKVMDEAGGPGLTAVWFEFHSESVFTIYAVFSTQKALEFVVMHDHPCLSGTVIDGGRGERVQGG